MCLALCFAFAAVSETVFLVDRYKSVDDYQFARYTKKRLMPLSCGFEVGEGFALQSTYEPYEKGFVVYVVDGRYSRLSFLVAICARGAMGLTARGAGWRLLPTGNRFSAKALPLTMCLTAIRLI